MAKRWDNIIVPRRNIYTNRYKGLWGLPKFQRGIIQAAVCVPPAIPADAVLLTNWGQLEADSTSTGGLARVGIEFLIDGSIDLILAGDTSTTGSIPGNEWWTGNPSATVGDDYDVRCNAITGPAWTFEPAAVGTWIEPLSSQSQPWGHRLLAKETPGSIGSGNIVFQIRDTVTFVEQDVNSGVGVLVEN